MMHDSTLIEEIVLERIVKEKLTLEQIELNIATILGIIGKLMSEGNHGFPYYDGVQLTNIYDRIVKKYQSGNHLRTSGEYLLLEVTGEDLYPDMLGPGKE